MLVASVAGFAAPPAAHADSFVPLTVLTSTMWPDPGPSHLRELGLVARNDSAVTLTNVQSVIRYFTAAGDLLESRNSFGDLLSRVAPGERIAVFDLPKPAAASYVIDLVAGVPTTDPVNRNFLVGTATISSPDSAGFRWVGVVVTNLNRTPADDVRAQFVCSSVDGVYVTDGPTFGADLAPGATGSLSQILAPTSPPCDSVWFVTVDSPSLPGQPLSLPGVPSAVTAIGGAATVTVAWSAPVDTGGAPVTRYEATVSPGGAICTTTTGLSCTVAGLQPSTTYSVTVTAETGAGTGAGSSPITVATSTPAPVTPSLTARLVPGVVPVRGRAVLQGSVTPVSGTTVTLERLTGATWVALATQTPPANVNAGTFRFTLPTGRSARQTFRVTATGPSHPPVSSPPLTLTTYAVAVTAAHPATPERVKVRNTGRVSFSTRGWRLRDAAGRTLTLPTYTLAVGRTLTIFTGKGRAEASRVYLGRRGDMWRQHDTVRLLNSAGTVVARYKY